MTRTCHFFESLFSDFSYYVCEAKQVTIPVIAVRDGPPSYRGGRPVAQFHTRKKRGNLADDWFWDSKTTSKTREFIGLAARIGSLQGSVGNPQHFLVPTDISSATWGKVSVESQSRNIVILLPMSILSEGAS